MSASPPKQEGVEPVQSPDEEPHMDRNTEENSAQIGYEFEVKEQDRWLPIANGTSISLAVSRAFDLRAVNPTVCTSTDCSNGRLWMPTDPRPPRNCVESRAKPSAVSHSAPTRAWKTADVQPTKCRPMNHTRPLPRHNQRQRAQPRMPVPAMLTYVTLLQLPES